MRLLCGLLLALPACTDRHLEPSGPDAGSDTPPEALTAQYSLAFRLALEPMGGESSVHTRIASGRLDEIENFVDLEKLRILFFTCIDDKDGSGKYDIFLFESKSRWVSQVTGAGVSSSTWQVASPVFTYGNDDAYDWDYIREALTTRPFKIAILANRPDEVRFGDFDNKFGNTVFYAANRGPYWGPDESAKGKKDFNEAAKKNFDLSSGFTTEGISINELHHCQWDAVYTSKNATFGFYDFIMRHPVHHIEQKEGENMMGAVSAWTTKKKNEANKDANYYFHPDKHQGIPMYGVQKFDRIHPNDWKKGTPYNVSEKKPGQSGEYNGKTISLLRSLVRLDLRIPKKLADGTEIKVYHPYLRYSNVMARCEPLDVATPTEQLWRTQDECEWNNLYVSGPIINADLGKVVAENVSDPANKDAFLQRMAWFYGAWQEWWDFNGEIPESYFTMYSTKPFPRIYNPCIQRNADARLDDVQVDDENFWYYVVYTGERNINDPSKFNNLTRERSEVAYFKFSIDGGTNWYHIALTDYSKNTLIKKYLSPRSGPEGEEISNLDIQYKKDMAASKPKEEGKINYNWNWPLLRNHIYRFTVTGINKNSDDGGLDALVVTSEDRYAPDIEYN